MLPGQKREPRPRTISLVFAILGTLLALNLNLWIADYFFSTGNVAIGFLLPAVLGFVAVFAVLAVFSALQLLQLKSGLVLLVFILPTLLLFAGGGVALGFAYKEHAISGGTVTDVSVVDAQQYRGASLVRYKDGQVLPRFQAEYVIETRRGKAYFFAAPVVPEDWNPTRPVPLWAIAYSRDGIIDPATAQNWLQPLRTTLRPTSANSVNYRNAVRAAVKQHKLTTAPDAPLIEWLPFDEASAELEQANRLRLGVYFGFSGLWLIALLVASLLNRSSKPA